MGPVLVLYSFPQRTYCLQTHHFSAFLIWYFSFVFVSSFPFSSFSLCVCVFLSFLLCPFLTFLVSPFFPYPLFLPVWQSVCPSVFIPTLKCKLYKGVKFLSVFFTALSWHLKQVVVFDKYQTAMSPCYPGAYIFSLNVRSDDQGSEGRILESRQVLILEI